MSEFPELKAQLRDWPKQAIQGKPYKESIYERIRAALAAADRNPTATGPGDLATLVRQVLRYETTTHKAAAKLSVPGRTPWPTKSEWKQYGCRALGDAAHVEIDAQPWRPTWLEGAPFAEAEERKLRRTRQPVPADPILRERFGRQEYLSGHQAEAVRAVMLSPLGAVRLIVLPTGAGKSLVGLAAALLGPSEQGGVSVFVVPTIALAFDQVRQARDLGPNGHVDAWHSGLSGEERAAIYQRIRDGQQRVIFCAPESVVGGLADALRQRAELGQLRAFVVDEAHLVSQWGTSFRPEFQSMSAVWRQLRQCCPVDRKFRTVLLTATLTAEAFADIRRFFGAGNDFEALSAVYLRQEPDYYCVRCENEATQTERVLETLRHAPRPAILYVTKVADAKAWYQRCLSAGWHRTGLVHGGCSPIERERVLAAWNANELDLVVATSAFGLGMDKADVRLVLHACVPETLDRYYQEVGRGGRDGYATVSLLLWTERDLRQAAILSSPAVVGAEIGFQRWQSMWTTRLDHGEVPFINLQAKRPKVKWDGERNRQWNLKTLLLLARAGVLEILNTPPPELKRADGESAETYRGRCKAQRREFESYCAVSLLQPNPARAADWDLQVGVPRAESRAVSERNWHRMEDLLLGRRERIDLLREVYRVPEAGAFNVAEEPSDVVLTTAKTVCQELRMPLRRALPVNGAGFMLVTYSTAGTPLREVFTRLVELLKSLGRNGVREVALPEAWRTDPMWPGSLPNPLKTMTNHTPENFLIVRDLAEQDPAFQGFIPVPRVSLLPPSHAPGVIPTHLFLAHRPVHLIVVPEECRDHQHPGRRVGDVLPAAIRIETLLALLKQ